jgi:hypothetical protein
MNHEAISNLPTGRCTVVPRAWESVVNGSFVSPESLGELMR